MKKLRVIAKVYDTKTAEYVQRYVELPVSDAAITELQNAIHPKDAHCSPLRAYGHGNSDSNLPSLSTPLRNEKRFALDAQLMLIDVDDTTGEETCCGGFRGI